MKRSVIPVFIVLCWATVVLGSALSDSDSDGIRACPRNEANHKCGFRCTESCNEKLCTYVRFPCEPGCFCVPTYMRIDGRCVPRGPCPAIADVLEP